MRTSATAPKRTVRSIFAVILAAVMLLAPALPAQAATKSLSAGTWAAYQGSTDKKIFYKVTIPSDGLVTVTKNYDGNVSVYQKASTSSTQYAYTGYSTSKSSFALSKGTYYFYASNDFDRMSDGEYYYNHRFKYTFKAVKHGSNYSLSRATALKANATVNVVQSKFHNYGRWYKIKVTKNQRITFWSPTSDIDIFDSKFTDVEFNTVTYGNDGINKYATKLKLPKGTYYFRINPVYPGTIKNYSAGCIPLKWK